MFREQKLINDDRQVLHAVRRHKVIKFGMIDLEL